jgi:protein SCO1/2
MKMNSRRLLICLLLVLPAGHAPALTEGIGIEPRIGQALPADMPFTDETGTAVRLGDYFHKGPALLVPVWFGCRKMCSLTLSSLAQSLRMLEAERGTPVIAVSIDADEGPEDGLQQRNSLQRRYPTLDIGQRWHFLTAPAEVIQNLSKYTGFHFRYSEQLHQYLHPVAILVLSPAGSISSYLFGVDHQPEQLRERLRQAGAGEVEPAPLHPLLLLCYRYDDATGRYTLSILKILRLCAALSVALLAGFIVLSRYRERRGGS